MSQFQFVHAADLHLDTPFEGMERIAPQIAEALRDASLAAWDELVQFTIQQDAAFLLLAGDIYDGEERGVRAQLRLRRGLERLTEHGIDTFIVHGNHDPLEGWSAIRSWPERVTIFAAGQVGTVFVERAGQRLATIHGTSYASRETTDNLALGFKRGSGPGLQIGLLHCNAGNNAEHAAYSPCSIADLRRAGMDYWALGHLHRHQFLATGDPWIVYPGNLQGRSPKPSECGEKGAVVVEVVDDQISAVRFAPLDRLRFQQLPLDISPLEDLEALRQALLHQAQELRASHGERGLLVRAILTGRGPLHADLRRPQAIDDLLAELRESCAAAEPFLWWESCRDRTGATIDKRTLRERDDFAGELARAAATLGEDAAALETFVAGHCAALGEIQVPLELNNRAPDGGGEPEQLRAWLEQAEDLALDLLAGEEPA